jgi:hypothetical protein
MSQVVAPPCDRFRKRSAPFPQRDLPRVAIRDVSCDSEADFIADFPKWFYSE